MEIVLSSRNPSKIEQIRGIFKGSGISVISLDDAGIRGEAVEDGKDIRENAHKKAEFAFQNASSDVWTMADDTGFFINALRGAPGHLAARWAGEKAETKEITQFTLQKLAGARTRRAIFRTVVVVMDPRGDAHYFGGEVCGKILRTPKCEPQPKMPYSSIFVPDGHNKVWAEMTVQEENAISHRGIAFRSALEWLQQVRKEWGE
jgi:XTP/dITP diphosphohydrolase